MIYCTYQTHYTGTLMPPFYIGSTSVDKVLNKNYHGSVKSKEWKDIWRQELKEHPELFKTIIISKHENDKEARNQELIFQKAFGVVKSPLFINKALAAPNGFFGMDVSGEKHPQYGTRQSEETKAKNSKSNSGEKHPLYGKKRPDTAERNKSRAGIILSEETKAQISKTLKDKPKLKCEICGKIMDLSNFKRWNHGQQCQQISKSSKF